MSRRYGDADISQFGAFEFQYVALAHAGNDRHFHSGLPSMRVMYRMSARSSARRCLMGSG